VAGVPAFCALTYVSANFWSISRVHSALAFDAVPPSLDGAQAVMARPARAIEQNVMVTLGGVLIYACLPVYSRGVYADFSPPEATVVWAVTV
jgi:hypothetical protein